MGLVRPVQTTVASEEIDVELRLVDPQLTGLSAGYEPPPGSIVVSSGVAVAKPTDAARVGPPAAPPLQITWSVELNLLFIQQEPLATLGPLAMVGPGSGGLPTTGGAATDPGSSQGATTEARTLLASGTAVLSMPSVVGVEADLLQMWLEMDAAYAQAAVTTKDEPLTELLTAPLGQGMLQSALAGLTTQARVRVSPLFAVAGVLSREQVASIGLSDMRVVHAVNYPPDGRSLLSLGVNFGSEQQGSAAQLQPFLGSSNFAYYVSVSTIAPVLGERWRINAAGRGYVGNVPVQMPVSAGSSDTGQGTARVQVNLGAVLGGVSLAPYDGEQGDVVCLACDETVQILQLWYADGSQVSDLGDLGTPATMPFVVNAAPFTPRPPDEVANAPLRVFVRYVLEPLAFPFAEQFMVYAVDGFASAALGAVVTRWSLALSVPRPAGGSSSTSATGLLSSAVTG